MIIKFNLKVSIVVYVVEYVYTSFKMTLINVNNFQNTEPL